MTFFVYLTLKSRHISLKCQYISLHRFSMQIGVLCLSHAMFAIAALVVCSMRRFARILATVMSLSLKYGSPEASCIKRADTYFGRRSASLANKRVLGSLNFINDSIQNSYGRDNPIFEHWSCTLFCISLNWLWGLDPTFCDQYP